MSSALISHSTVPGVLKRLGLDGPLLAGLLLIMAFGLYVLYSAGGQSLERVYAQAIRLGVGLVLMVIVAQFHPHRIRQLTPLGYGWRHFVDWCLVGRCRIQRGATLVKFGVAQVSTQRLVKILVPMMIALWVSQHQLPVRIPVVLVGLIFVAIPVGLIARQPDLGTSLLVAASGIFVILLAGIQWRWITGAGVLGAVSLPLLWMNMHAYQQQRVLTFLDPESDPLGAGWNIIQSRRRSVQAASLERLASRQSGAIGFFAGEPYGFHYRGAGRRAGYVGCPHPAGAVSICDALLDPGQSSRNDLGPSTVGALT